MHSPEPLHPIAKHLRAEADPFAVQRLRRSIQERRSRRRRFWVATSIAACSVPLVLILWSLRPSVPTQAPSASLALLGEAPLQSGWRPPRALRQLDFNDGSSIALASNASLMIEQSTPTLLAIRLERGEAEFFVNPGGPRMWRVLTEEATVTVLGTRFKIRKESESSRIYVYQGKVMVEERANGRAFVLKTGSSASVPPAPTATAPVAPVPSPSKAPPNPKRSPEPRSLPKPKPEPRPKPDPKPNKRSIRPKSSSQHSVSSEQLLRRSDEAKAAGDFARAAALLETLLETAPNSTEAPYAAYALGVLQMDMLDQPKAAKATFRRALNDQRLPSSLRRLTQLRLDKLP